MRAWAKWEQGGSCAWTAVEPDKFMYVVGKKLVGKFHPIKNTNLFSKEDICTVYWSQKQKNHNCPSNIHLVVLWPALQRTRLPEDRSRFGDWGDKIVGPPPPTCWPGTGSREVLAGVRIMLQAKVFSPGPDVPSKRTSKTIMVAFQARPNDKWYKLSCCIPYWRTK